MNLKLSEALAGRGKSRADCAALRIASTLRGPDSEDIDLKRDFTTPIRVWALDNSLEDYSRVGYTYKVEPRVVIVDAASCIGLLHRANELYTQATRTPWPGPNLHYIGHVCIALAAIAYLEGWKDPLFNRWFREER